MSTTPDTAEEPARKGKLSFFRKNKSTSSSANRPTSPAPAPSESTDHSHHTFNRTDNLHNFGVALELLGNMGESSELLAPLKAVCGGLKILVDVAETIQQNDQDLRDLAIELGSQLGDLEQLQRTLSAIKSNAARKEVENLVSSLNLYISDLKRIQETLEALKYEETHRSKRVFKRVWTFHSTGEEIKGYTRQLDRSFQRCKQSVVGFIAHQTVIMRNDLANDAISRLPCAEARGNQHEACLKGTRVDILERVTEWYTDSAATPVLGLVDQAGTGKSTISAHMARKWEEEGIITARFFFSLPKSVTTGTEFATTLARDLAKSSPSLRALILKAIDTNSNITGYSIEEKLQWFVLTPLRHLRDSYSNTLNKLRDDMKQQSQMNAPADLHLEVTEKTIIAELERLYTTALEDVRKHPGNTVLREALEKTYKKYIDGLEQAYKNLLVHPPVIIIDALDECSVPDRGILLNTIIGSLASNDLGTAGSFKLFLTCRPESDITTKIHDPRYNDLFRQLNFGMVAKSSPSNDDIALYAREHLSDILDPSQIILFVARANGLFIWAATAKAFLLEAFDLSARFQLLMARNPASTPLDALYETILNSVIKTSGSDQLEILKKVVQAVCVTREPLSTRAMDEILGLGHGVASRVVTKLGSVLSHGSTVQVLHPTFIEYVLAGRQPYNLRFAVRDAQALLAGGCLNALCSGQLKYDTCGVMKPLERAPKNLDIEDLHQRIETNTTPGLRYAAVHGVSHIISSLEDKAILRRLREFFESSLLHWIEFASLLGDLLNLILSVNNLKSGLEEFGMNSTDTLVMENKKWCEDTVNMIQPFQAAIESAMQVYISALPFAPSRSKIAHSYNQTFMNQTPKVVRGPTSSKSIILVGHTVWINCLAFSPDGRRVASGSNDCTIRLWDTASGAAVGVPMVGHTDKVSCLSFSGDGQMIASGSYHNIIRPWDSVIGVADDEPLAGHTDTVSRPSSSHDGRGIESESQDFTVRLWNATTGTPIGEPLVIHTEGVSCLSFSLDGRMVACGLQDCTVRMWNTATGTAIGEPLVGHTSPVLCLSFSRDGRMIASGSQDCTVRLWDAKTGAPVGKPLTGHIESIKCVSFSLDCQIIASGSLDDTVRLWEAASGAAIGDPLVGHDIRISCLSFSPDGQMVASGSAGGTIRLWNPATGMAIGGPLVGHISEVSCLSFSPDGRTIASGSHDCSIRLWDAACVIAVGEPPAGHTEGISCLSISPDDRMVASGSDRGTICLWDAATGEAVGKPLVGHTNQIWCLSFSSDSRIIASGSREYAIRVWDAATGAAVGEPFFPDSYTTSISVHNHHSGILLVINNSETAWNFSTQPPTEVHFTQEWTQSTSLLNQVSFHNHWTYIESPIRMCFILPSGFPCTQFSSRNGLLVYGGADGSVIIIDFSHLLR